MRPVLVSGDNRGSVNAVAAQIGIAEVHAEVLPGDKARVVAALREGLPPSAKVAMVGDGINDAPALAAADVGIAMATGTDIAMQTGGDADARRPRARRRSGRDLARDDGQDPAELFWAFVYNAVGIPLAALGWLSPVLAGAAMAASKRQRVVTNALLLRRWRPKRPAA